MATNKPVETISGVVEQISAKRTGIRIAGEWLNLSQYHPIDLMPQPGQRVEVQIDRSDRGAWINSLSIVEDPHQAPCEDRAREIRSLACLKAAATFAAGKCLGNSTDIRTADVLKVAEAFEQWVHAS
jgi:hypothetical protein